MTRSVSWSGSGRSGSRRRPTTSPAAWIRGWLQRMACPAMSDLKAGAARVISERRPQLVELSERIHANPELGWQEHRASGWVAETLTAAGFTVERPYLGFDTALRATFGTGPHTVGLCAEYDALPGLGHACGHNLISAMSVGAALALAAVADQIGLTVVL